HPSAVALVFVPRALPAPKRCARQRKRGGAGGGPAGPLLPSTEIGDCYYLTLGCTPGRTTSRSATRPVALSRAWLLQRLGFVLREHVGARRPVAEAQEDGEHDQRGDHAGDGTDREEQPEAVDPAVLGEHEAGEADQRRQRRDEHAHHRGARDERPAM